jgi:hypothetical protein
MKKIKILVLKLFPLVCCCTLYCMEAEERAPKRLKVEEITEQKDIAFFEALPSEITIDILMHILEAIPDLQKKVTVIKRLSQINKFFYTFINSEDTTRYLVSYITKKINKIEKISEYPYLDDDIKNKMKPVLLAAALLGTSGAIQYLKDSFTKEELTDAFVAITLSTCCITLPDMGQTGSNRERACCPLIKSLIKAGDLSYNYETSEDPDKEFINRSLKELGITEAEVKCSLCSADELGLVTLPVLAAIGLYENVLKVLLEAGAVVSSWEKMSYIVDLTQRYGASEDRIKGYKLAILIEEYMGKQDISLMKDNLHPYF